MFPIAIDYGRFSDQIQEIGDSKRRQKSLADAWSERTEISIDTRLVDEGVSGYKRQKQRLENAELYDLARFLKMIEAGRVQPGDYLLLENLDRLSRDNEVPATHLLTSILMAGVHVVQLAPYELELTSKSDGFTIMRAVMELARGHGESARKHQVVAASYANNRAAAGEAAEAYQGSLPAWVKREGKGKGARHRPIVPVAERVAVVRQIYQWAAEGWGYTRIVHRLNADGVAPFGSRRPRIDPETGQQARTRAGRLRWEKDGDCMGAGRWTRPYVVTIIRDRAAVGELMTRTGEIIPIPPAVSEELWLAAQAGREDRMKHRGRNRTAGPENLFQGMLRDALTGESFFAITRQGRGKQWRVLINAGGKSNETEGRSFPEQAFEEAILHCLHEIDPAEITTPEGPDRVAVLSGRIESLRGKIARQTVEIEASDEPAPKSILQMMSRWETEAEQLEGERRQAQQDAAHPLSETWGQAKGLLDAVKTTEERIRFRSLLRRIVEDITVLIVPRGWDRIAAVQIHFAGSDKVRSYLIVHQSGIMPDGCRAKRRRGERGEERWFCRSFADILKPDDLDLRQRDHTLRLEKALLAIDVNGQEE
jgi:hypothetical protein